MQGVVPAAGQGTRMRPLTAEKPKGLVEVAGKPLLTHVFETLTALDVRELIVVIGYRGDQIREHYGGSFEGTPISYVTQQSRDGLADALLAAESEIETDFVWLNGDNVVRANTDDLVQRHAETDAAVTALVEEVTEDDAGKGAVFELTDGEITGIVEKPQNPPSRLVPRGCYAFSPKILHAAHLLTPNETGEYELTDAIDLLLSASWPLETVDLDGRCYNVNTPADRDLVAGRLTDSDDRATDGFCAATLLTEKFNCE
ncbi:NTP transferase domain-containing protein [Halovenus sp. WSH3]|uniref:NTP transferase domain-containing protein n=1 Tax=Halovenus carboxidivorans TaxID=2692199 RepID=A0A6B0TA53_9EURY|nr:sugar phosphate nucleotidyltransferase [Halovenus carboxidivorans]MXR53066.1 NTP transferase domain-containing protein [Halovenus carboxidivorans]